jgi:hypothetical protein
MSAEAAEPLLIPDTEASALAGVSRAHWCRLEVAGKTPAAVRLGRKKLYRRRDLELWIEWACPPRVEFEARLGQTRRLRAI